MPGQEAAGHQAFHAASVTNQPLEKSAAGSLFPKFPDQFLLTINCSTVITRAV